MEDQELLQRIARLENQVSALKLANKVILEELVNLYHRGEITQTSVKRLFGQIDAIKTLRTR
jgi:hypothetical protein